MEIKITGCIDCPFKYEYDMAVGYGCKADNNLRGIEGIQYPRSIKQSKQYQPIDPDWCPLKNGKIVVQVK